MNEYKDFKDNLDLIFKIKYHGDDTTPVKIFDIQKEADTTHLFQIESTYGTNEECYELYFKETPIDAKLSIVGSDEETITIKAVL
jgi:hypothetical protein